MEKAFSTGRGLRRWTGIGWRWAAAIIAGLAGTGWTARASGADPAAGSSATKTTVVWISMDGFRSDYLDRATLPFFARLMKEGAYSRKFHPVFPPITFPSHCSEATGVPVSQHGISGNGFYDTATHETSHFPSDSSLLQAEPIWLTSERQGVRTLVFDWPLSQAEHAPLHADYFNESFDNKPTDAQRLDHLLDVWKADPTKAPPTPLRLVMGYVEGADPDGHRYGPNAPELTNSLKSLDETMGKFFDRAVAQWKATATPADRLYVLLTTDHGMSAVQKSVSLEKILGVVHGQPDVKIQMTGNLGNVFLLDQGGTGPAREARLKEYMDKLKAFPFLKAYRREDLPPAWGYGNPTRTGDITVVAPKGYSLAQGPQAVFDGGPKGMHGYPVEDDPEMYGVTFVWRYPPLIGGKDLGEVMWDQYHPTVAKWLGIQPAAGAKGKPLGLPGE